MWSVVTLGRGGGETGSSSPAPFFLFTPGPREAPGTPWLPSPLAKPVSISHCLPIAPWVGTCGPSHTLSLSCCCGFRCLSPPKVAVGRQQMRREGLFIARIAGAWSRAWGLGRFSDSSSGTSEFKTDGVLGLCVPLGGSSWNSPVWGLKTKHDPSLPPSSRAPTPDSCKPKSSGPGGGGDRNFPRRQSHLALCSSRCCHRG